MGRKSRSKRERRAYEKYLDELTREAYVEITRDLPLIPAGIYRCISRLDSILHLRAGDAFFAIGTIYAEYIKPVKNPKECDLVDEASYYSYVEEAIARLTSSSSGTLKGTLPLDQI